MDSQHLISKGFIAKTNEEYYAQCTKHRIKKSTAYNIRHRVEIEVDEERKLHNMNSTCRHTELLVIRVHFEAYIVPVLD